MLVFKHSLFLTSLFTHLYKSRYISPLRSKRKKRGMVGRLLKLLKGLNKVASEKTAKEKHPYEYIGEVWGGD